MKTNVSGVETKDVDTDARTVTGLASTWELNLGGDVIRKGAFTRTLDHWRQSGRAREAEEADAGLVTTFSVPDDEDGRKILTRVEAGIVNSMSIGYNDS